MSILRIEWCRGEPALQHGRIVAERKTVVTVEWQDGTRQSIRKDMLSEYSTPQKAFERDIDAFASANQLVYGKSRFFGMTPWKFADAFARLMRLARKYRDYERRRIARSKK